MSMSFRMNVPTNTFLVKVGRRREYIKILHRRLTRWAKRFVKKIKTEQMSGRRAGDIGLNVVSGRLRRAMRSKVSKKRDSILVQLINDMPYAIHHERGTGRLKKRLFIGEELRKARGEIRKEAKQVLKRIRKNSGGRGPIRGR